jgi:spore germination protein KB
MKLETEKITSFQFMFTVACFLQSSALLSAFFAPITQQDSWLVVLFGMMCATPILLVYCALIKSFPGQNLIQITLAALGKPAGTLVSLIFIWFFLTLSALNLRDFGQFVRQIILVETPSIAVVAVCITLVAYTVLKGVKVVTRYAPMFALLSIMLTIIAVLLTLNLMDFNNFLPMMAQEPIKYIQGTNIVVSIPFGELVVMLMIAPNVVQGKKKKSVYLFGGFLVGSGTILSVSVRDIAVLGRVGSLFSLPSFETLRLARVLDLNRMEILFAIVLIVLLFFKICCLFYVSVLAIAQLFNLKSYHPLVLMLGALIVGYSFFVFPTSTVHSAYSRETAPILWLLFEFLLPLLVLIIGRARGLHKPQESERATPSSVHTNKTRGIGEESY